MTDGAIGVILLGFGWSFLWNSVEVMELASSRLRGRPSSAINLFIFGFVCLLMGLAGVLIGFLLIIDVAHVVRPATGGAA